MSVKSKQSLSLVFLLVFQSLFASIPSANWQGTGNMTSSNLTQIWNFINGNQNLASGRISYANNGDVCRDLSNHLNGLWDPAWNVVIGILPGSSQFDTVLYGYAFRGHWMWYNNYKINSYSFSFIIWKDYNCQTWTTASMYQVGFNDQQQAQTKIIREQFNRNHLTDIWAVGKKFIDDLSSQSLFQGIGLSIVVSQSIDTNFYSHFCSVKNKYELRSLNADSAYFGQYLLFQTR